MSEGEGARALQMVSPEEEEVIAVKLCHLRACLDIIPYKSSKPCQNPYLNFCTFVEEFQG
jgi:hypothetical protein